MAEAKLCLLAVAICASALLGIPKIPNRFKHTMFVGKMVKAEVKNVSGNH